jgi:hypothetical protein
VHPNVHLLFRLSDRGRIVSRNTEVLSFIMGNFSKFYEFDSTRYVR